MLGGARPEKDVKSTREFDWRLFFSDGNPPYMCSFLRSAHRRIVSDACAGDSVL